MFSFFVVLFPYTLIFKTEIEVAQPSELNQINLQVVVM